VVWALVGKLFTAFILYSSHTTAVYTGFAVVLTTLIWIYLSWLILLLGAQLAFYVQFPQYLRPGRNSFEISGRYRERTALSIMILTAGGRGPQSGPWSAERLAEALDVPTAALSPIIDQLQRAGLLRADGGQRLAAGRDPADITLLEIWRAARDDGYRPRAAEGSAPAAAAAVSTDVEAAVGERLAGRTLRDLIEAA
jgi:membrane protein